jgi:hypothetical protein
MRRKRRLTPAKIKRLIKSADFAYFLEQLAETLHVAGDRLDIALTHVNHMSTRERDIFERRVAPLAAPIIAKLTAVVELTEATAPEPKDITPAPPARMRTQQRGREQ